VVGCRWDDGTFSSCMSDPIVKLALSVRDDKGRVSNPSARRGQALVDCWSKWTRPSDMRRISITQIFTVECSPMSLSARIKFGSLTWTYEGCEGRIVRGAVMTRNTPYVGGSGEIRVLLSVRTRILCSRLRAFNPAGVSAWAHHYGTKNGLRSLV